MFKKTTCPVCGAQWNEGNYDKCPNCGWVVGAEAPEKEIPQKEAPKGDSPKPIQNEQNGNVVDEYEVNPRAENIADKVAGIILLFGWIIGIVGILAGIIAASNSAASLLLISLGGVIYILISYVIWAFIKMFVNMSRNLFNIKDMLRQINPNK